MTRATATKEIAKLTSAKVAFSIGKSILLMRIFLIREAESMIELIEVEVASETKEKSVCPRIR